jgi:hypothetical protein
MDGLSGDEISLNLTMDKITATGGPFVFAGMDQLIRGQGPRATHYRDTMEIMMFFEGVDPQSVRAQTLEERLVVQADCTNDFEEGNIAEVLVPYSNYLRKLLHHAFGWPGVIHEDKNHPASGAATFVPEGLENVSVKWNPKSSLPFVDMDLGLSVLQWVHLDRRLMVTIDRDLHVHYTFIFEKTNIMAGMLPGLIPKGFKADLKEFIRRFPITV